ncbi:MAG: alpha/beta hydrolase [Hymenobacteraceae bacterium]|nr:alpha/beta hydrolase [Hymenobacteraceae bacterium]
MKKLLLACLFFALVAAPQVSHAISKSFYFTTSDSVQLYVRIAGEGKPCLFIHGGPGSWTKYFYALGGDVVEKDMTMIYVDQRGCGRSSSAPDQDYSLARVVQDFEELRQHLGYDKWMIMPHSFGGTIATEYAYQHPERITAGIFVNTTLYLNDALESYVTNGARLLGKPESDFRKAEGSIGEALNGVAYQLNQNNLMYKMMYPKKEMFDQMNAVMDTTLNWDFGSKVWDFPEYAQDFTAKSASIKMPVLVISGNNDLSVGPDHYRLFKFANATYRPMDTGHCPYQEQTKEFHKHVRSFLRKVKS